MGNEPGFNINSPGRTPTNKPGFLPNLRAAMRLFVKNPVSRLPCVSPN